MDEDNKTTQDEETSKFKQKPQIYKWIMTVIGFLLIICLIINYFIKGIKNITNEGTGLSATVAVILLLNILCLIIGIAYIYFAALLEYKGKENIQASVTTLKKILGSILLGYPILSIFAEIVVFGTTISIIGHILYYSLIIIVINIAGMLFFFIGNKFKQIAKDKYLNTAEMILKDIGGLAIVFAFLGISVTSLYYCIFGFIGILLIEFGGISIKMVLKK